jgi:hypothetical protein
VALFTATAVASGGWLAVADDLPLLANLAIAAAATAALAAVGRLISPRA